MRIRSVGAPVRDPVTLRHLPPEGKDVPESTYWLRRLAANEVEIVPPPVVHVDPPQAPQE